MFHKFFKIYIKNSDKKSREKTFFILFSAAFCGMGFAIAGGYIFVDSTSKDIFAAIAVLSYIAMIILVKFQKQLYQRESKRAEEQKKEIQELNAAQTHFFSSMSHELRTPINTIIGLNEMILREDNLHEIREDAQYIKSASSMLLHLVNDILDISKLNTGQMHLVIAPYYMGEMLSDVMGMLWHSAREKGLNFKIDVASDVPAGLLGDEIRIKQVLINIINNAIKYTDEGSVLLSVQCERKSEREATIIYSVSDTGIGIRKESIPYLFTAFSRVDEAKNRHIEGTGLGLSIVRQFVEMMNGKVSVNSVYTKGSTFIIEIPQEVIDDSSEVKIENGQRGDQSETSSYTQSFEAPKASVLVVDDTLPNLIVVQKMLKPTKVRIVTAESGREALKKTQNESFDVIFMDHMMPEMDGIETMHRIRSQLGGKSCDARVVAFTANADDENRFLYEREGFDGYLVKPVTGEEIERELIRLLPPHLVRINDDLKNDPGDIFGRMTEYRKKASVIITTDSVAGLSQEIMEKYKISVIPYTIVTEEGNFRDRIDIETDDSLMYMMKGKRIHSVAPSVEEYEQFFANGLTNANNIIHISITSQVQESGYAPALEASRSFENVFVVDCGHLESGAFFLTTEAGRMTEGGMGAAEILERLKTIKNNVETTFILKHPDFLAGDDVSAFRLPRVTTSFMMYPMAAVYDGKVRIRRFFMGTLRKVWKNYIDHVLRFSNKIDETHVIISYAGITDDDLEWIKNEVSKKNIFKELICKKMSASMAIRYKEGSFGLMFVFKA